MTQNNSRIITALFAGTFVLAVLIASDVRSAPEFDLSIFGPGLKVGTPAPDFTLQDKSGKWVSLSDFKGKKVFIFHWSTWCKCKYQLPAIEKLYQEHKSENFEVIAVASDSQGFKWVTQYLDIVKPTYTVLVDPVNSLGDKYNVVATENAWLIDEAGIIRMNEVGYNIRIPEQKDKLLTAMKTDFGVGAPIVEQKPLAERIREKEATIAGKGMDVKSRLELAELYKQKGDLKTAEATLRDAVRLRWISPEAHYRLGVVLYQKGLIEEAVSEWEKAYRLEPTSYLYYRNIQSYHDPDEFYIELKEGTYPHLERKH